MARITPSNESMLESAPVTERWVALKKDKEEEESIRLRASSGCFIDGERHDLADFPLKDGNLEGKVLTGDFSGLDLIGVNLRGALTTYYLLLTTHYLLLTTYYLLLTIYLLLTTY